MNFFRLINTLVLINVLNRSVVTRLQKISQTLHSTEIYKQEIMFCSIYSSNINYYHDIDIFTHIGTYEQVNDHLHSNIFKKKNQSWPTRTIIIICNVNVMFGTQKLLQINL